MNRKNLLFFSLVALLLLAFAAYQFLLPPVLHGAVIDPPKPMPDFRLSAGNGPVSLSSFQGKVVVLFFGFTNCKDICPATMAKLASALDKLGSKAGDVQVIFISVDYKRDTPRVAMNYATRFRSDFIGLGGILSQIDGVARDFGIAYSLGEPDASGNYEVEHTATILVLDRQGRLVMTWSPDQQPDEIASDLQFLTR